MSNLGSYKWVGGQLVPPEWYMLEAVIAHEEVHETRFEPALEAWASSFEVRFEDESLKVPDTGQTQADAIAQIKALPEWERMQDQALEDWTREILIRVKNDDPDPGDLSTSPTQPTLTQLAEIEVVDPMLVSICIWRAAQTPPLTGCPACNEPIP